MRKIIIFMLLLSGCVTQERCLKRFPVEIDTVYSKDVVYRDTVIERIIPGDTVFKVKPVYESVMLDPVKARTELAEARAWVDGEDLSLSLVQFDSVMKFKIDSAITVSRDTIIITTERVKEVKINKPAWKFWQLWLSGFLAVLFLVLLIREILR
jgi:hypothetical protein